MGKRIAEMETFPTLSDMEYKWPLKELRHNSARRSSRFKEHAKQPSRMLERTGCFWPIWESILSAVRRSEKQDKDEAYRAPAVVTSSGFRGVIYHSRSQRWKAYLWNEKEKNLEDLGSFFTPSQAARAYDRAVINGTSLVNFQRMTPVLNFDVADYSREMKQLMETSQERLVVILRKQSAGARRALPDYSLPDYSCTS